MSIEEIKKRHEESIKDGELRILAPDVEYLLQRLEIAQNCLQEVFDSEGLRYVKTVLDQLKE